MNGWIAFDFALVTLGLEIGLLFLRHRYQGENLDPLCVGCGYNLRGSLDTGVTRCPECGTQFVDGSSRADALDLPSQACEGITAASGTN